MKRFSDFAEKHNIMTGDKVKISDVVDKERLDSSMVNWNHWTSTSNNII